MFLFTLLAEVNLACLQFLAITRSGFNSQRIRSRLELLLKDVKIA